MELVPLETRLIRLNYANASELQGALGSSLTRRGTIQTDKRTNSLIVTDVGNTLDAIEKMAVELDTTTPQNSMNARKYGAGARKASGNRLLTYRSLIPSVRTIRRSSAAACARL